MSRMNMEDFVAFLKNKSIYCFIFSKKCHNVKFPIYSFAFFEIFSKKCSVSKKFLEKRLV